MDMKPTTAFRLWVQRIWMDNCEERLTIGENSVTINQYWNTYKYWLKQKYQQQKAQDGR